MNICELQLAKHSTVVGLLRISQYFLFECAASNRANLAFKTIIIEDTHLTLIGILFKLEANNSLIFLPLQTYEKKFAEFPFLFISIIPCTNRLLKIMVAVVVINTLNSIKKRQNLNKKYKSTPIVMHRLNFCHQSCYRCH